MSTTSANESITVVFVQTTPRAFDLVTGDSLLSVVFQGTFADGTRFLYQLDASPSARAIVTTHGNAVEGIWDTTGFGFRGSHDLRDFVLTGHNATLNISGSMTMRSVAPPHLPCGPNVPGGSELVLPGVYGANAVADAVATIDFDINGRRLKFVGSGYHDKNWGVMPFRDAVQTWYFGHARLGPYSIIWLDGLTTAGEEKTTAYVAKDGKILLGTCQPGSLKVRPWGKNSEYPPVPTTGVPEGLTVDFDLGAEGKLHANVTTKVVVIPSDNFIYGRYVGPITGGIVGGEQYTSNTMWEQFKYFPKAGYI